MNNNNTKEGISKAVTVRVSMKDRHILFKFLKYSCNEIEVRYCDVLVKAGCNTAVYEIYTGETVVLPIDVVH